MSTVTVVMTDEEYIEKLRTAYSLADTRGKMSDAELLALFLSYTNCAGDLQHIMTDISDKFMHAKDVYRCSYPGLMQIDKMTHHGACAILLAAKAMKKKERQIKVFKKDSDYEELFFNRLSKTVNEELWAAVLSRENKLVDIKKMSVGSSCHADIFIGDLIEFAVAGNCRKMVIAHSHPHACSTDISEEDERGISYFRSVLARFDIDLYGHVIVSENKAKFYKCSEKEQ